MNRRRRTLWTLVLALTTAALLAAVAFLQISHELGKDGGPCTVELQYLDRERCDQWRAEQALYPWTVIGVCFVVWLVVLIVFQWLLWRHLRRRETRDTPPRGRD